MTKKLTFQVRRTETLEYVVDFFGEDPPWSEEELALGRGLQELNDMECDEEFSRCVTKIDSDIVYESPDEYLIGSYQVTEAT